MACILYFMVMFNISVTRISWICSHGVIENEISCSWDGKDNLSILIFFIVQSVSLNLLERVHHLSVYMHVHFCTGNVHCWGIWVLETTILAFVVDAFTLLLFVLPSSSSSSSLYPPHFLYSPCPPHPYPCSRPGIGCYGPTVILRKRLVWQTLGGIAIVENDDLVQWNTYL
jgi:hypothetical protein